jgi:hypothetical protein
MLAEQGPRLETLRALEREIDLLGQSYGLEKKNTSLTGQEDRLKEIAKSTGVTEELRQQVARAQEGELSGLARINAAYQERLRHLKEEGEINTVNAKLAGEIRDAEIARFEKEEQRKTAAAVFGANTSLGEAGIRSNYAIFQANRKASGAAFGEADINAEYDTAMALAQRQFDLAAQHVRELRDMNATDGEIQRAQIEATKNFALAALDAETKKRVELIDLARQQRDEESKTARANYAKRIVKQLYSINIDNSMARQIAGIAQQKYAGHVSIAVRDPDVRKMLMLYSEATGQKMPLSATTRQSASLAEMGGKLYQQATYVNGSPYAFQSNLPVLGGYATGTYPSPGPMMLQVNVQGQGAAQFVAGQVVTPEFVQAQWSSAAAGSNGRLQNSAVIQQPGLVVT